MYIPHRFSLLFLSGIRRLAAPPVNSAGEPPEVAVANPSPVVVAAPVSFGRSIVDVPTTNSVAPGARSHVVPSITVVVSGNKVSPFGKIIPTIPETVTLDMVKEDVPRLITGGGVGPGEAGPGS
jgi:hypothetical protein